MLTRCSNQRSNTPISMRDAKKDAIGMAARRERLLEAGFTDTFRHLYPDLENAYTWWSYMFKAREKNAGWRIDYFLVSSRLADKISAAPIYAEILGSDHCPVGLEIDL